MGKVNVAIALEVSGSPDIAGAVTPKADPDEISGPGAAVVDCRLTCEDRVGIGRPYALRVHWPPPSFRISCAYSS